MARDVEDLALFLDALDPHSIREETSYQRAVLDRERTLRVAWTSDFGGTAPVESKVADACLRAAQWLANGKVCFDSPDVVDASRIHDILRAHQMYIRHRALLETGVDDLPEEVRWQLQHGEATTQHDLEWAIAAHDAYQSRFEGFMKNFDVLACPAAAVLPFPAQNRWVQWVGDEQMENYVEWLRHTYVVSLANVPAISLPCGWTEDGLPIGIQLVARRGEDRLLLSAAASLQEKVSREMIANGQPAFGVVVKPKLDAMQISLLPRMPEL